MKFHQKLKGAAVALLLTAATNAAMANQLQESDDAFYKFWETVNGWTTGALGVGLATTMLLMGGAIGVAKNTPMPALTGIAGAAFLNWGPQVIQSIMLGGTLI